MSSLIYNFLLKVLFLLIYEINVTCLHMVVCNYII